MFGKINNIAMFVFIIIGALLMILTVTAGLTAEDKECIDCWEVNYFIYFTYFLFIGAILAALAGVVMKALSDPKGLVGSLTGVGIMLVIVGVSYALADGTVLDIYGSTVTETAVKWSDTGLFTFYILFVLSILSIMYTWVSKLIK
jgi:hypothetical protein